MTLNDIYELSGILQGDDEERNELERKKITLNSTIRQQEGRLYHEIEEKQKFNEEVQVLNERITLAVRQLEDGMNNVNNVKNNHDCDGILARVDSYLRNKSDLLIDIQFINSKVDNIDEKFRLAENYQKEKYDASISHLYDSNEKMKGENERFMLDLAQKSSKMVNVGHAISFVVSKIEQLLELHDEVKKRIISINISIAEKTNTLLGYEQKRETKEDIFLKKSEIHESEMHDRETLLQQLRRSSDDSSDDLQKLIKEQEACKLKIDNLNETQSSLMLSLKLIQLEIDDLKCTAKTIADSLDSAKETLTNIRNEIKSFKSQESATKAHNFSDKVMLLTNEAEEIQRGIALMRDQIRTIQDKVYHQIKAYY